MTRKKIAKSSPAPAYLPTLSPGTKPARPRAVVPPAVRDAAQALSGFKADPHMPTEEDARAALKALGPALAAYPEERVLTPKLDVQKAVLVGLAVHALVSQAEPLRARLEKLHAAGEFDLANIDLLRDAVGVTYFAYLEARREGVFATEAKVPRDLVVAATEVEKRMQRVCEHLFADDPEIAPLLKHLRPGSGHRDLVHDLQGYAGIYEARADEVAQDAKHYRPTDLADANRLVGQIIAHLGPRCSRRPPTPTRSSAAPGRSSARSTRRCGASVSTSTATILAGTSGSRRSTPRPARRARRERSRRPAARERHRSDFEAAEADADPGGIILKAGKRPGTSSGFILKAGRGSKTSPDSF